MIEEPLCAKMNCRGCGADIEPSEEQANLAVDQVLQASIHNAEKRGGVCPLCGHSKDIPAKRRPPVLILLLIACLILAFYFENAKVTHQKAAADEAEARLEAQAQLNVPAARIDPTYPCVDAVVGSAGVAPHLGACALAAEPAAPVDRFESDLRYGRFVLRETDLALHDDFEAPLTRTYSSQGGMHPNPVHAFGMNSNHPFDIAPVGSRNPYTFQMIALEDGDFVYFDRISKGVGYADAVYRHSETATRFYKATQRWNGDGWRTKLADGSEIIFPDSYSATNMAQGAPTEMRNSRGEKLELMRDGQRNLQEILTPHGHWIKFQYDGQSRVTVAADDAGNWAKYAYTADGMLESVALSLGKERHYTYDGVQMSEVKDEKGRILVSNLYAYGELVGQKFSDGSIYSYSYTRSPDRRYVEVAHITLPDHSTRDVVMEKFIPADLRGPH
jgi:YD repeat-containing protein